MAHNLGMAAGAMRIRIEMRIALALVVATPLWGQAQTYHARIVVEGGAAPPSTPQVIPAVTNRLVAGCFVVNSFGDGVVEYQINWNSRPVDPTTLDECEVNINVKGYPTTHATLKDGAVVVLKRAGDHEGNTISETSLSAPKRAREAFERGIAAVAAQKLDKAQKYLEEAVAIYPEYAAAWTALGELWLSQKKPADAKTAWEHAVQADPRYFRAYLHLERLAITEGKPEEARQIGERAIALNPVEFPGIYFYHAVANFALGHTDIAEQSARRTTELDTGHEFPRAEYLLGSLLANKGDRKGAVEHLNKYLEAAPKAQDAATVRQRIEDLERNN